MIISTPRLTLIPADPAQIITLLERPEDFAASTGIPAAPGLYHFYGGAEVSPAWIAALRGSEGPDPWRHGFFVVHTSEQLIIGTSAFKGAPDADGMVEIAYGIVPAFEGKGFATEAAAALVNFACEDARVRTVLAHTLPEANASTSVLKKCGFAFVGDVVDPDDGPVWRWRHQVYVLGNLDPPSRLRGGPAVHSTGKDVAT